MVPLLQINNLKLDFATRSGVQPALNDISFCVNNGEIVALVGESGSGKSVTALSVMQLVPSPPAIYTGGEIILNTQQQQYSILKLTPQQIQAIRGNKISMIFQEPMTALNPVYTCGAQVAEILQLHRKLGKAAAQKEAVNWFKKVLLPNPESIYKRYPHQLSGGQKQRVMIAMALCCHPDLLICDEPTTALDVTVQKNILQLIKQLQQETGMGVLFITHDLGVVAELAHRAVVMYKGNIVEDQQVQSLFTQPQHPYTKALLACRPVLHKKGKRLPVVADFLNAGNNTTIQPATIPVIKVEDEVLLEVKNLSVKFSSGKSILGKPLNEVTAVNNVSFIVNKNEILGLVGESGCGKTTLSRTLLRLIAPTSGSIVYNGNNLLMLNKPAMKEMRQYLQIIFQDPYSSLNPRLTVGSAIIEALRVFNKFNNDQQRRDKVMELLEKVELGAQHYNRYPHEFSGGQRQRIVIARALALNPDFLICDESVSALDVSVQAQVLNLLNDLKNEFKFSAIFISHDLGVVRYMCNRIMVMQQGQIVETGEAETIYSNPTHEYTRKLIDAIPVGIV